MADFNGAADGGAVATDSIWAAAGDIVYATADDTASVLSVGTNSDILQLSSGIPDWTCAPTLAALTVGSAGCGGDVTFHSCTSGDQFLWDSSCEKLVITGTCCATALCVPNGDVVVAQKLYFYDRGGEYLSSNGSTLAITGATTVSSTLGVTGIITATAGVASCCDIDLNGNNIDCGGVIFLKEQACADADVAGSGQIWVNTETPNALYFTDDAGTDFIISKPKKTVVLKLISETTVLTTCHTGLFTVPSELCGMNLVDADAAVYGVSSSGLPTIQIHNLDNDCGATDMLSTEITINACGFNSYVASTQPVIDTCAAKVVVDTGDRLRMDVDVAGTGTDGLDIIMVFQTP